MDTIWVVLADHAEALRQHGVYVTAPRLAVMRVVSSSPHIGAEAVVGIVRSELGSVSRQAVYETLNTLTDLGLIRRIQPMGSPARYESRTGDNHHHLLCRSCGAVEDVDCAVGARPCLTAADGRGYLIDEAEVIYWGVCPGCQQMPPEQPSTP